MWPLTASMAEDVHKHHFNGKLYSALMKEEENNVFKLCQEAPENAMHILTVNNDTVLHMATYSKQAGLVHKLLDDMPHYHLDKMTRQNELGNTILHEADTTNQANSIVEALLGKALGLLSMRNHLGETALFQVARYGKTEMFELLANKISGYNQACRQTFLQRNDKTTVLHISIFSMHFDLALKIAKRYEHLIGERDVDRMTALQLLSSNPSAFKSGSEDEPFKRLLNSVRPGGHAVQKEKQRYVDALELAKFFMERDTSWEITYPGIEQSKPRPHKYGFSSNTSSTKKGGKEGPSIGSLGKELWELTPLFLATKSVCVEIVEEIVKAYIPSSSEHIDDHGRNILHVVIKYRQLNTFELVTKMGRWLVRKVDNKGNSILHMVGKKRMDYVPEQMRGPAIELEE